MAFNLDQFVSDIRTAAADPQATRAVSAVMEEAVSDPGAVAACVPAYEGDELTLYEDESLSIQCVRFDAGLLVPPHNHKIPAFIGVYEGTEVNQLFRHDDGGLELVTEKPVRPGQTLSIGSEGIHGVYTADANDSLALHVYLGNLKTISRSLFDRDTGEPMPFTDENYASLVRPVER